VFADLTVRENLAVGRRPPRPGLAPWDEARLFALFPNLAALRDRPGGRMSGGEQQMLTIARTLMGNPRALLLDEPSEGIAPIIVAQMVDAIRACLDEGLAVVLAEQSLGFAGRVAERACVIETGRPVWRGQLATLIGDAGLRSRYLAV
jgi:branched-chain amino acid transport system ATP-binding protein